MSKSLQLYRPSRNLLSYFPFALGNALQTNSRYLTTISPNTNQAVYPIFPFAIASVNNNSFSQKRSFANNSKNSENDNDPFADPLLKAIGGNDTKTLKSLLEQGKKPDYKYLYLFIGQNTEPRTLDLLAKYSALPESNSSLVTLKLALFLEGNRKIKFEDLWNYEKKEFLNKYQLNLAELSSIQKSLLIEFFARTSHIHFINELIKENVQERPINHLFLFSSPNLFMGCNPLEVDEFKRKVSANLSGRLENECKTTELLFAHPNEELDIAINKKSLPYKYLPLFAWAAKNNNTDILESPHFEKLLRDDKDSSQIVAVISAAFGSKEFLVKAINKGIFDTYDIEKAASIAAANNNNDLLYALVEAAPKNPENKDKPLIGLVSQKIYGFYHYESFDRHLHWAVRNGNNEAVEFLLKSGVSPNEDYDVSKEKISSVAKRFKDIEILDVIKDDTSYLSTATIFQNIEAMKLLISYGAGVNYQDKIGKTALHYAAYHNNLDAIKILVAANANVDLVDKEGKKPLDCILDSAFRKQVEKFISDNKKPIGTHTSAIQNKRELPPVNLLERR